MDQSRPLRVALGSDHGGFLLNEDIKAFLVEMGYQSEGFGTHFHASVNFPNDALLLAKAVSREEYESCFAPPGGCVSQRTGFQTSGRLSVWNCSLRKCHGFLPTQMCCA
jgi:hypothetical protein